MFGILTLFALVFFLPQAFISTDASAGTADITLSVTTNLTFALSSHNLTISSLAPGAVANSNVITISTNTNNSTGYTLAATVGDSSHNTTSLIRSSSTDAFEGLDTSSTLAMNNIPDSKWGFSSDSGLTFSGLPLYTDTPKIIDISSLPVAGGTINFSIAAHAPSDMSAGTYENVITFSVVANYDTMTLSDAYALAGRTPVSTASGSYYTMQDMSMDICNNVDSINSSLQLLDTRDNKLYWVTKLADGNCWMTQNLDYDIKSTNNILSQIDGATTISRGRTTFDSGLYSTDDATTCALVEQDCSYDSGNYYVENGTGRVKLSINCDGSINDGENCHYQIGNYYQIDAAVDEYNLRPSICPQHWKVPTASMSNALSSLLGTNISTLAPTYFNYVGYVTFQNSAFIAVNELGSSGRLLLDHFYTTSINDSDGLRQVGEDAPLKSTAGHSIRCVAFAPAETTTITLSFDLQGGTVASFNTDYSSPIAMTIEEGGSAKFVFTKPVPQKTGKKFTGWKTDDGKIYRYDYTNSGGGGGYITNAIPEADGYFVSAYIIFSEDTTLRALWGDGGGDDCPNCSTS